MHNIDEPPQVREMPPESPRTEPYRAYSDPRVPGCIYMNVIYGTLYIYPPNRVEYPESTAAVRGHPQAYRECRIPPSHLERQERENLPGRRESPRATEREAEQ